MKKRQELLGIEILRFLCAFGVILAHYHHFFFVGAWNLDLDSKLQPSLPWYGALRFVYDHGGSAVQFFWAISGYIFYLQYSQKLGAGAVGFSEFFVRRFSRLYP